MLLTVPGHADCKTFLEPAVLAAVAIEPDDETLAVAQTPVLDLFLYTPSEETLDTETYKLRKNAILFL